MTLALGITALIICAILYLKYMHNQARIDRLADRIADIELRSVAHERRLENLELDPWPIRQPIDNGGMGTQESEVKE